MHILVFLCTQSGLTLCDPMDCSPPGSSIHGIFQAGILEQVAISFLLQGIVLTQGLNTNLTSPALHWLAGSLPAEPPEKPHTYTKLYGKMNLELMGMGDPVSVQVCQRRPLEELSFKLRSNGQG